MTSKTEVVALTRDLLETYAIVLAPSEIDQELKKQIVKAVSYTVWAFVCGYEKVPPESERPPWWDEDV